MSYNMIFIFTRFKYINDFNYTSFLVTSLGEAHDVHEIPTSAICARQTPR